jgi:BioD-like phosphotransacetylase family protein
MNKYPEGKLNAEDEGYLSVGIRANIKKKVVEINFFKPIVWVAMGKQGAYELAEELLKKAALL